MYDLLLLNALDPDGFNPLKSTWWALLLGFILGAGLVWFFGWGIALILGRRFVIRFGLIFLAVFVGIIGALIGDHKAAAKRPLNEEEMRLAKYIFGQSIDYSKVKIAFNTNLWAGPTKGMNRTPFNTIYLSKNMSRGMYKTLYPTHRKSQKWKPKFPFRYNVYNGLLIHELTHVWQTQHGIGFFKKAKTALRVVKNRYEPYYYGGQDGLVKSEKAKRQFRDFNTEQQGAIMEHYFDLLVHRNIYTRIPAWYEYYRKQVEFNNGYQISGDTVKVNWKR